VSNTLPQSFTRARLQLMLRHPFLAAATARYPIVDATEKPWCDTMATDGYYIYVDAPFCARLSEEQTMAVLAHEVMHCVLGHIDRRGERDRPLWNRAIDYATNLFLAECGFQLPPDGLLDRRYRGLTAEEIYAGLCGSGHGQVCEASAARTRGARHESTKRSGAKRSTAGSDLHLDPADPEGAAERREEYPTPLERRRLSITLTREVTSKLHGRQAGLFAEEIKQATSVQVPWQNLLARFFTGLRRNDFRLFPPNRKHLWRGLYLPSLGTPGPEHVVVAIDTSGSMNAEVLAKVLGELDQLRAVSECRLTLLECDARVQAVSVFEPWELSNVELAHRRFHGRGGTDLRPPFAWVTDHLVKRGDYPDAMFYFTDGYGTFPDRAPPFPVLWIVPRTGVAKVRFGELLALA
jgi:predicted metal-dependent peptidase